MNTHTETKINQLLQLLPSGSIATTKWLRAQGIGLSLITAYVRSGWLDRISVGAVARRGQKVDWYGAVYALQSQLGLTVHPAAKTALGLLGSLHYVPFGHTQTTLLYRNKENLPKWFIKHNWSTNLQLVKSDLFGDKDNLGLANVSVGELLVKVSSHERAIIEYLHLLENENPGDEPLKMIEGMAWLRPEVIQNLLEACISAKAKRLFLVLAEKANHPWFKKLDLKKVDIGKGKRQFIKGGHLNQHFQITIPNSWQQSESEG